MMRFAHEAVKERRKELGLTQAEISERLIMSQGAFSLIERGCSGFSVTDLIVLSDILDLSIDELFTEDG